MPRAGRPELPGPIPPTPSPSDPSYAHMPHILEAYGTDPIAGHRTVPHASFYAAFADRRRPKPEWYTSLVPAQARLPDAWIASGSLAVHTAGCRYSLFTCQATWRKCLTSIRTSSPGKGLFNTTLYPASGVPSSKKRVSRQALRVVRNARVRAFRRGSWPGREPPHGPAQPPRVRP
jgi:hypothetical protein